MEENQVGNSKKSIIVSVVVLVLVAAVFYYFYRQSRLTPSQNLGEFENLPTAESAIPPSANPLLLTTPEATPVEKTNPFKYENPFE